MNSRGRQEAYLIKRVQPEVEDPTKIVTKLDLWFPCWNKCGEWVIGFIVIFKSLSEGTSTFPGVLTSSKKFTKEAARDIYLSIVLVEQLNNSPPKVSEEQRINIWSKVKLF